MKTRAQRERSLFEREHGKENKASAKSGLDGLTLAIRANAERRASACSSSSGLLSSLLASESCGDDPLAGQDLAEVRKQMTAARSSEKRPKTTGGTVSQKAKKQMTAARSSEKRPKTTG